MELSYQEKSIWGSLAAIVIAYGYYFSATLREFGRSENANLGRLVLAVIMIVVIETVYQIVLAIASKEEPKDERDTLISSKAYRNAYFFLYGGAGTLMTAALGLSVVSGIPGLGISITPYLILNVVLLLMVLAELVKFCTQLFYYRRGF
jgi:hypothetical protein